MREPRTYSRAEVQRLVNAAAIKVARAVREACLEVVRRHQVQSPTRKILLEPVAKQIRELPEISGVNLADSPEAKA